MLIILSLVILEFLTCLVVAYVYVLNKKNVKLINDLLKQNRLLKTKG